jgi:DNA-binding XRE family transcriptional regulator
MDSEKKKKLVENGWTVGTVQDFLGMTDEEARMVEWRVSLGRMLKEKRKAIGYTQTVLAREIGSNQSRIAKMEAGDSSVSIDLILKSLFHIGSTDQEICKYIESYRK